MGRKIPSLLLTLITTIGSSGILAPTAFAEEPIATEWTVPQALSVVSEIDNQKTTLCGQNWECRAGLNYAFQGLKGKLGAAATLIDRRFMVTYFDPANNVVKLLHFDENVNYYTFEAEHFPLEELYVFRLDDSRYFEPWNYYQYKEAIESGNTSTGIFPLIAEKRLTEGEDWFPAGQEITYHLDAATPSFTNFYYYVEDGFGNIAGGADLPECLNHENYAPGMACRMVIDNETMSTRMIPFDPAAEPAETGNETEPNLGPTQNGDNSDITILSDPNSADGYGAAEPSETSAQIDETNATNTSSEISTQDSNTLSLASSNHLAKPDTGAPTAEEHSVELPWWMSAILALGAVTLAWLFWPTKSHKNRK